MEPEYITVNEYSRLFGPRRTKVYGLIKKGDLISSFYGGRRFIEVQSARDLAARSTAKRGPANDQ